MDIQDHRGGSSAFKTSVRRSKHWKSKHLGADVHDHPKAKTSMTDPKARTSMTPGRFEETSDSKNFGSLVPAFVCSALSDSERV